jgi:hypothetical protein
MTKGDLLVYLDRVRAIIPQQRVYHLASVVLR